MAVKKTETARTKAKTKKTAVKSRKTEVRKGARPVAATKGAKKVSAPSSAKVAPKRVAKKTVPQQAVRKAPVRPAAPPARRPGGGGAQPSVIPLEPKPSARTCPLVLDGIIRAEDFSPKDCLSCDEFDCRFYTVEARSSVLGSRLFVSDEEGDDGLGEDTDGGFGGFYDEADADSDDDDDDMR